MKVRKNKAFLASAIFAIILPAMIFVQPVSAKLSDWLLEKYSNYQIYFYNSHEECIERDADDDTSEAEGWDGHCASVSSYDSQIEAYFDAIYDVAQRNGLPWEGIVAQLIKESSFMKHEACPFNPLGLKGQPSCDSRGHRSFGSYEEAFSYYVNSIVPVREAMGKFPDDPYGYIEFLINGVPGYKYATDPNYINSVSAIVCGVQKWALAHNKPISGDGPPEGSNGGGSSGSTKEKEEIPYCRDDDEDDDEDEDEDFDPSDWVFPLKGATKSNYMHGSSLSPLPCRNMLMGGCHHDYYAMDLGLTIGTKTENDFPDLKGKFASSYWTSVGVKVVAMTSGKITSYKPYGRATMGYQKRCASVTYETNDGRKFWLGHMLYDGKYRAGDSFNTGAVIGEVGPPPCAVSTQAHLHVDETPKYGNNGSVKTVELINMLYEKLP